MSRGPLFLSASSGLASLAASNPTALSDLTGCGVRIGHNSAAEVLQAAMGRTVARSGSRQSWADARAPAGHGSRCGPSGAALCQIGKRLPISNRRPSGGRLKLGGCQGTGGAGEQLRASCGPPGPNRTALSDLPTTKPKIWQNADFSELSRFVWIHKRKRL